MRNRFSPATTTWILSPVAGAVGWTAGTAVGSTIGSGVGLASTGTTGSGVGEGTLGAVVDSTGLRGGPTAGDGTTGGGPARIGQLPAGVDLDTVRAHYRRYLELSGNGRLEEAGRELQKIGELLGVRAGR